MHRQPVPDPVLDPTDSNTVTLTVTLTCELFAGHVTTQGFAELLAGSPGTLSHRPEPVG